jgi:hypothetical protein
MKSVIYGLPSPSVVRSLSLRVDDRRELDPWADFCEHNYRELLQLVCKQLSCAKKWPHLTSSNILVDVSDNNFTEPVLIPKTIKPGATRLEIVSLLQVNISTAERFSSLVAPRMG